MTAKPWLHNYPPAIPAEIDPDNYVSLKELVESNLQRFADRPAFTTRGTTLSYADIDRLSLAFASYLQVDLGLARGERVAVMLPNLLQSPIVIFGILRAGLVVVDINPLYTARELQHQLDDSGARAIVVMENFAHTVEAVLADCAVRTVIVTRLGDHFPVLKRIVTNFAVKYLKKLVPAWQIPAAVDYLSALESGRRRPFEDRDISATDLAFLQYTGGTTGRAKGAMLTQRNMVSNVLQAAAWVKPYFGAADGDVITALPLYHVFALTVNLFAFIELGASNILITNPRDLEAFVSELATARLAFITGVNTLFNALLKTPTFRELDFSALRVSLGGGMAVQRDVAERWQALTGVTIAQGYGLTETSPIVAANILNVKDFDGSVGMPLPSTEVKIVDDSGKELAIEQKGEICVRGPQVMAGYWNRPKETAAAFLDDGWLLTGDIGHIDQQGRLYIEDRKKDLIIVSGFNVYPNEIEDVVTSHPRVTEAAAIGISDEDSGEVVKIFVVRHDDTLTKQDLVDYCRQRLTGYKIPKAVEFVADLPKTNVGKVLRRALKTAPPD